MKAEAYRLAHRIGLAAMAACVLSAALMLVSCGRDRVKSYPEFVVDRLGKYDDVQYAYDFFSPELKKQITAEQFEAAWHEFKASVGSFQTRLEVKSTQMGDSILVVVKCRFDERFGDVELLYDKNKDIAGMKFVPGKPRGTLPVPTPGVK